MAGSRRNFSEYNTASRNLIGVAYLDGENPSIIAVRGTYGLINVEAYRFSERKTHQALAVGKHG